ncbi:ROK family protein [Candidatus Latescibacterota bacterium]
MAEKIYIGVDLGGTTITAGAVEEHTLLSEKTVRTKRERSTEEISGAIIDLIEEVSSGYDIGGIGIGVPNPAGPESNRLVMVINIPSLEGFPLKSQVSDHFKVPVVLENDANCMAFGELCTGGLKGCSNGVCVTLGTGLGCGVIIEGKLYRGAGYSAGEIWNIPGRDGLLLEDSVSLRSLKDRVKLATGCDTSLSKIRAMYDNGDSAVLEVFDHYGEAVGAVMVLIISCYDPERIVIGGGVSTAFDTFRPGMMRVVEKSWGEQPDDRIIPAVLSLRTALLGAAGLAREASNE